MSSRPSLDLEQSLWTAGNQRLVGLDEVGRGCLSGPVVAAAVLLPFHCSFIAGVNDSKQLSARVRERLCQAMVNQGWQLALGAASVAEIDRLNIRRATHLAMRRALARLAPYDHALIDGQPVSGLEPRRHTCVIRGDSQSFAIACASIVAKVARDRMMHRLAIRYPGYGWERNAGYGTAQHLQALTELGVTPWHRRSFAPVKTCLSLQQGI